jgi:hypothetical protein
LEESGRTGRHLAGSTSKKVVIRRFEREPLQGFVNPQTYLCPGGIELLSQSGAVLLVPYEEVKAAYFVRDFGRPEPGAEHRVFNTRPKISGIWIRMRLRDGELMDGILANDLLQIEPSGFTLVPPSPSSNNQKMFIPRAALTEVQVLGVVGSPLHPHKVKAKPKEQIELFE